MTSRKASSPESYLSNIHNTSSRYGRYPGLSMFANPWAIAMAGSGLRGLTHPRTSSRCSPLEASSAAVSCSFSTSPSRKATLNSARTCLLVIIVLARHARSSPAYQPTSYHLPAPTGPGAHSMVTRTIVRSSRPVMLVMPPTRLSMLYPSSILNSPWYSLSPNHALDRW